MLREVLSQQRRVIGTFSNLEAAGQALDRLVLAGFPIAQVFLVGQNWEPAASTPLKLPAAELGSITGTATGLQKGLVLGNLGGGAAGLLVGAGLLALPGVGQLLLSAAIGFTLLSGAIGTVAGGLIGALIGLGLTAEQAQTYNCLVADGKVLLMIAGTTVEIDRAQHLFNQTVV
jgi:hypothetical protein